MIENTIIFKKFTIKNWKRKQFNYLSLGEITSQDFLNWEKSTFSIEANINSDPEKLLYEEMSVFSEFYKIWKTSIFYKRKYAKITLKLLIKGIWTDNMKFYFNKYYYNLIRFKVDNLYPIWLHITDLMLTKLILNWNLVVHGASVYNEKKDFGFSLIAPPDTGKTYTTFKFLETEGFKFLWEDLSLWDSESNTINCMPYTSTWGHRFSLSKINIWKIPFLWLFFDRKKHSVYDIFGEKKVQKMAPSRIIYLLEKSNNENIVSEVESSEINEIIRKIKVIQRNEFSYYKNPLLLAIDYANNIDLPWTLQKENELIEKYFSENKVYIVKWTNYKNYYELIKTHQETLS